MVDSENQKKIFERGEEIFRRSENQSRGSIFNKDWWYGKIMDWSMKNEAFKTQMFRFVDVLPYLKSGPEVARHLKEYFAEGGDELPSIFKTGAGVGSLAPGLMAGAIRKNVSQMAKMFITGETPKEALPQLIKARKNGIGFTADILGEATLSEKEAQEYSNRYIELITWLAKDSKKWKDNPHLDTDHTGDIPKVNVSVKLSAFYSQINVRAWDESKKVLKDRLRPVLKLAQENGVFLNFDMEQYSLKEITLQTFKELITEPEFKNYPHFGIVIQAYLRDSLADTKELIDFAQSRGVPFSIRLVKGAYWDYETVESEQKDWPYPVYTVKRESDANYEDCFRVLLDNYRHVKLALGSHNVRSIAAAMVYADSLGIPKNAFEIQMLYGMADQFKGALTEMGYRVREYATIGELIPGMAYLVRRLLENTSNESFLRGKFSDGVSTEVLLKDPSESLLASQPEVPKKSELFYNHPLKDFGIKHCRDSINNAIDQMRKQEAVDVPLVLNGERIFTSDKLESVNPSHSRDVVAKISLATPDHADKAVEIATKAWPKWRSTPVNERADLLDRLAQLMEKNKFKLMAEQIFEVGKTWEEADGDVAEAIDFCKYYAKDMRKLSKPQRVGHAPGEISLYSYHSRGVCLVIAPWNFPLAIITGMVAAAVVTGNTVIMKPAEQSSLVAFGLMELLKEAGCPEDVVQFLPGKGEEVGEYLLHKKEISTIAFTGSKAVGLHIIKSAGITHPGQENVKRCIIEMGGKNALIIDSDADLDEAVVGVCYSAFGFAGQKCSACSRVIVHEDNYDRFIERLVERTKSLKIRASEDPEAYLGPVIDQEAYSKISEIIAVGKKDNTLAYQGEVPEDGFYIPPTIFTDVKSSDTIAQQEIFGPVLAVIKAKSIEEAVEIGNDTEYALTGGVYSRSPENIEYVKNHFEVGNLYINRGITGALVDRHPFGGFKMSGIGSKTGGPDYLKQYMEPRVSIENTLRRGFAPSEDLTV